MHRGISFCWILLSPTVTVLAQSSDKDLNKGRELLLVEEYHPAKYYLKQAVSNSKSKVIQEEAQILLTELFLVTRETDSARTIINHLPVGPEVLFLGALLDFQENKLDEALPQLKELEQATPEKNSLLRAKLYYYSGVINFRKRSAESIPLSIHDLQQAVAYFKKDSSQTYLKLSLVRLQLADVFRYKKQSAQALFQLNLAKKILQASPYSKPLYLANAFGIEGRILYTSGKLFAAKSAFEKTVQMQRKAGADSATLGVTFSNLALCFDQLHDFNACENAYDQTGAYWATLKNQNDRLVPFLNNYGWFKHSIQESAIALETLKKAIPLVEEGKLQSKSTFYQTYFNLASIYYDLGDFTSCKKYLDRLDLYVKENPTALDHAALLTIDQLRAMWLRKEKRFDEAIDLCRSIDMQLDSAGVKDDDRAKFYKVYGDILVSTNRYQPALVFLHKANDYYEMLQSKGGQIEIANLLAMNFFGQALYDSAVYYCSRALQLNAINTTEALYPYLEPQDAIQSCYLNISSRIRQFQKTNNTDLLDKAIPYEVLGVDLIRSIRKNLYSDADRITYNQEVTKFYDACCLLYFYRWQMHREGSSNKFFEYAEESKFQALANGISTNRVNSFKEVSNALLQEEKNLAKLTVLQNKQLIQLLTLATNEDEVDQRKTMAKAQLQFLERKHDQFLDSVRRNFSGYYLLKYGGKPIGLEELKAQLQGGQLVLQFKVIDSLVVVQAITSNFVSLFSVADTEDLRKQVNKLRNLIQFKMQSEFVPLSHNIFQSLIEPVNAAMKKNKIKVNSVIVVPDDFIHLLPFEALVEQTKPLRYFIQSQEISYAYSCNLMVQNKRDLAYGVSNNFLGIAPRFGGENIPLGTRSSSATAFTTNMSYDDYGFQPLKENENEINLIANLVNNRSLTRTLLSGDNADEGHLKKIDLSKFRYIHFATHGFVNANNSGLSGLALTNAGNASEDNILYTSEIYNLNLRAELVCLSACETGLGQSAPGEGLIGLGRAFFYSGARNLLVSLWKVPDESTSQFMYDFYQQFFNPSGHFSTSLRLAKLKMLKTQAYQNPYYWAPFILVGSN